MLNGTGWEEGKIKGNIGMPNLLPYSAENQGIVCVLGIEGLSRVSRRESRL